MRHCGRGSGCREGSPAENTIWSHSHEAQTWNHAKVYDSSLPHTYRYSTKSTSHTQQLCIKSDRHTVVSPSSRGSLVTVKSKIHVQLCSISAVLRENSRTVVWLFFAILRESSKCLAIVHEICMWFNGYLTSSATVRVICHRRLRPHHHLSTATKTVTLSFT